jgi:hypothetical protein
MVVANYGHVPYGQSFVGNLYYNESNPLGCAKDSLFTDFDFDVSNRLAHSTFVLVERGECTFVTKTRNIAREGGQMAIIIDNSGKDSVQDIIMSDDGTGSGIRIPSILISQKDGEILKKILKGADSEQISKI